MLHFMYYGHQCNGFFIHPYLGMNSMNTVKILVSKIKLDHPKLPLTDAALEEIKAHLSAEYNADIAASAVDIFVNTIFYKNSAIKSKRKFSINGHAAGKVHESTKIMLTQELDHIKNEAHKIVKKLRAQKIKTPLSMQALHMLEQRLIITENVAPKIVKKVIYSFMNSISYQRSIMKKSNKYFFDLDGVLSPILITAEQKNAAHLKWTRSNMIYNH